MDREGGGEDNGAVILSLSSPSLSPYHQVMTDSSLLQRDGVSYKTAESEEKREEDEKKMRTVGKQALYCNASGVRPSGPQ